MLASLLPGLRDIRVPLTVGYLWLFNLWIWFADEVPRTRPSEDGPISRTYELLEWLGPAAQLGLISFCAYLLGALLQLPLTLPAGSLFKRLTYVQSADTRQTRSEFEKRLDSFGERLEEATRGLPPDAYDLEGERWQKARNATVDELRPRLLVANQELYGEYDRLASEAQFRINVAVPLFVLGATLAEVYSYWLFPLATAISAALMAQGLRRREQSVSVIQRAVLDGTIRHPAQFIK